MKVALIAAGALLLSACSTQTIRTEDARETERIHPARSDVESERVIVKRNTSLAGAMCADRVYADGKPVADIRNGEKVTFSLKQGQHILGVEKVGICPGQLRELTVDLKDGRTRTFLVDVSVHGEYIFQETAR